MCEQPVLNIIINNLNIVDYNYITPHTSLIIFYFIKSKIFEPAISILLIFSIILIVIFGCLLCFRCLISET